mgnify:CR=1 FL=1
MEWQGAWCDGSDEIVENIDLLNEWINVQRVEFGDTDIEGIQTEATDGTFLISFDDFW